MPSLTSKIAVPIILAGLFAITIFLALDYERLEPSFFVVLLLLSVSIFFFGFAIGQNFVSPIKRLIERATNLSNGDLTSRVYLESKDEFGELAKIFNKIAEELQESHCETQKTEESVGIKVKARTQALEETINALEQKVKNRTIELERLIQESKKLQEDAKSKETEAEGFRKELNSLKSKVVKSKPNKVIENSNDNA